jgi:hypothetical protein
VPKAGYVLERLRQPHTRQLLVLGIPFLLVALLLRDIWRRPDAPATANAPTSPVPGVLAVVALLSLGAAAVRARSG